MKPSNPLLSIQNLRTCFKTKQNPCLNAVDGISLDMEPGEVHGIVGESGSGKTVTALSILRLIDPPGKISGGKIFWQNRNLLSLSHREMRKIRGGEIAMIFQNPQAALNPLFSIGEQLTTVIRLHRKFNKKRARQEALDMLGRVQIHNPKKRIHDYPDQLSGGQCQRVMIAMALACRPRLLIADEPTAALDVTIQAQILDLILELREEFKMALLIISHDLGIICNMTEQISVMYLGKIMEQSNTNTLYSDPRHPYTRALIDAIPIPEPGVKKKFSLLSGDMPPNDSLLPGCRFRPRCPMASAPCETEPELTPIPDHPSRVACWCHQGGRP